MKLSRALLATLSVLMAGTFVNCAGQSSDPYGQYANGSNNTNGGTTTNPTPTPNPQAAFAICNGFAGQSSLNGKIKAYFDNYGTYSSNYVRVRLNNLPQNWASDNTLFIEFYRWGVTPSGTIQQDTVPLKFRLEDPMSGGPASGYFGPNGSQNVGFNVDAFYSARSTTNANALLDYNFLVLGTDLNLGYQVLRVTLTRSSGGQSTVLGMADMLIPVFDSNPNRYSESHVTVLNQLHPNWLKRTEGWSDANYLAFTQQYCF